MLLFTGMTKKINEDLVETQTSNDEGGCKVVDGNVNSKPVKTGGFMQPHNPFESQRNSGKTMKPSKKSGGRVIFKRTSRGN